MSIGEKEGKKVFPTNPKINTLPVAIGLLKPKNSIGERSRAWVSMQKAINISAGGSACTTQRNAGADVETSLYLCAYEPAGHFWTPFLSHLTACVTSESSYEFAFRAEKQSGAVEACWAHNPEVRGSKPRSANCFVHFYVMHFFFFTSFF